MDVTSSVPKYIAHIKKSATGDNYLFQSNEEHREGVAELAERFASEGGLGCWGDVFGRLCDGYGESPPHTCLYLMVCPASRFLLSHNSHAIQNDVRLSDCKANSTCL